MPHRNRKPAGAGAPAPVDSKPPTPPAAAVASQEPGPLCLTVAINRATARVSLTTNMVSESDFEMILGGIELAAQTVRARMIAAAEERGAAKAKGAAAPKSPGA